MYAGKGYDVRADWWSLGVLFYECIYNKRPFEGNSENSLSQTVQAASPKFPITQPPVSLSCLYAIGSALEPNPAKRMGATWESFIYHDFFKIFDFEMLERKQIEPVFVPSSDKTNFDATYDLEELLLEEAPLEARARRQKPREKLKDDATEKEVREDNLYRTIENEFRPFDYTLAAYKKYVSLLPVGCPSSLTDPELPKGRISLRSPSMMQHLAKPGHMRSQPMKLPQHSLALLHKTFRLLSSRDRGLTAVQSDLSELRLRYLRHTRLTTTASHGHRPTVSSAPLVVFK